MINREQRRAEGRKESREEVETERNGGKRETGKKERKEMEEC